MELHDCFRSGTFVAAISLHVECVRCGDAPTFFIAERDDPVVNEEEQRRVAAQQRKAICPETRGTRQTTR